MSDTSGRAGERGQLSAAGIFIGCVGCVILTSSSVYTALKMGSLPWPTIFTSITALVLLRALGHRSLNEANVTQIIMSAGSMVAGGLAFTIPGIWMLGLTGEVSFAETLGVALAGTLLGLVCTALIRRRFVVESTLEYPVGTAAAETLRASRAGSGTGKKLFGSMAFAGIYCVLRDVLHFLPARLATLAIPGVNFAINNSPMMLATGFLVGTGAVTAWFVGALLGNFGVIVGGTTVGLWDVTTAKGIVSSLGMGLMMGSGIGVVIKDVLPQLVGILRGAGRRAATGSATGSNGSDGAAGEKRGWAADITSRLDAGVLGLMVAAAALVICFGLGLGPVVAVVMVLFSFVTTIMSAQSVGQTGIDPMEIFGLIVLLAVAAFSDTAEVKLFFVAGVIAVACGLAGDVMSDFKTGHLIGTNPRTMWMGQAIGSLLGAVVATVVLSALVAAYGPDAFGTDKLFVAAQANVVATMVSGIPSMPAFALGLAAGVVLYLVGLPAMMLGLGVYLPFYMSFTAFLGSVAHRVYDRVTRARGVDAQKATEDGLVVASGLLGGESIVGVIIALVSVAGGLMAM